MPLSRSKGVTTMFWVKFLMRDGETEVACRAARELLRYTFDRKDRGGRGTFNIPRLAGWPSLPHFGN
jgi:hypothetical protein